jgi:hypothetical protein
LRSVVSAARARKRPATRANRPASRHPKRKRSSRHTALVPGTATQRSHPLRRGRTRVSCTGRKFRSRNYVSSNRACAGAAQAPEGVLSIRSDSRADLRTRRLLQALAAVAAEGKLARVPEATATSPELRKRLATPSAVFGHKRASKSAVFTLHRRISGSPDLA